MTFGNEGEAWAALMGGTATSEDLREIVTRYPNLTVVVAAYPATDPPLLEWLSNLGDPAVTQALASRQRSRLTQPVHASPATGEPGKSPERPKRGRRLAIIAAAVALAVVGVIGYRLLTTPDPATHVAATVNVGNGAEAAVAAPDGTVYVSNPPDGTVSVIKGDQVTSTIPVGEEPAWSVVAPDGTVYVTNTGDGTVSVIHDTRSPTRSMSARIRRRQRWQLTAPSIRRSMATGQYR